jgi:hypothetical protein
MTVSSSVIRHNAHREGHIICMPLTGRLVHYIRCQDKGNKENITHVACLCLMDPSYVILFNIGFDLLVFNDAVFLILTEVNANCQTMTGQYLLFVKGEMA